MPPSITSSILSSSRNNSQSSLSLYLDNNHLAMDPIDAKARMEYERERQKAHKGHDIRRKLSGLTIKAASAPSSKRATAGAGAATGGSALGWRNSRISQDDMEDYDFGVVGGDEFGGNDKENSRPSSRPVSVSLEDFVVRTVAGSGSKKLRQSVSRTSLSRQASIDNLSPNLVNVSLTSASQLPSISELHLSSSHSRSSSSDSSILLSPMLPPSDYESSTDDELDDDDLLLLDFPNYTNDDEFSSPEAWEVDEAEESGPKLFIRRRTSSSAFASSSCW